MQLFNFGFIYHALYGFEHFFGAAAGQVRLGINAGIARVNITEPGHNEILPLGLFNVTVNLTAEDAGLKNCNITLSVSNSTVLNITENPVKFISVLIYSNSTLFTWLLNATSTGTSNITATSECQYGASTSDTISVLVGVGVTSPS